MVRTSPHNRIDRRFIYVTALVLGAVLLVAGVGYKLIADSDEGQPDPQNAVLPEGPGGLIKP